MQRSRPERIVIDGSQTNREAILSCDTEGCLWDHSRRRPKPIRIRQSAYLNNRVEQVHRAVKRRVRAMLGFKTMMRKGQVKYACRWQPSLADQFNLLAV
jgi:transposase-like protein